MMMKLIAKDFRAYWKIIGMYYLLFLLAGNFFIFRFYAWHVYAMYGNFAIITLSTFFVFIEKNKNTEILTCTLPVTRNAIVLARYATTSLLLTIGLVLWYLNGYLASLLHTNSSMKFDQLMHAKVVLLSVFFFSIHASIFLPAQFRFRRIGSATAFMMAIVTAVVLVMVLFSPHRGTFNPSVLFDGSSLVVSVLVLTAVLPIASLLCSHFLFRLKAC